VRVSEEIAIVTEGDPDARFGDHLKAAVQAELGRVGMTVVRASDKSVDLTLRIETRISGAVYFLRGHVGLTAEKAGVAVAIVTTDNEFHRDRDFPTIMAQKAVALLMGSPALAEFADKKVQKREVARDKAVAQPAVAKAPTSPSAATQAKAHYQRGTGFYNLGRFEEALNEYEAAYLLVQDPPFLFNIAQCHRKLGNNKEALGFYRSYLRVAPDAPNRTEVQKRIAELERGKRASR
jgi:tetratricopeptide (TPR) repeat protein